MTMIDKVIVPYVKDDAHNAPRWLRPIAYPAMKLQSCLSRAKQDELEEELENGTNFGIKSKLRKSFS